MRMTTERVFLSSSLSVCACIYMWSAHAYTRKQSIYLCWNGIFQNRISTYKSQLLLKSDKQKYKSHTTAEKVADTLSDKWTKEME